MCILLMIIFSQPYHVSSIGILGTYSDKTACVKEQKRAVALGTSMNKRDAFGCVKIEKFSLPDLREES